jgi:glycosyltransferase involved in cell wall biosynthesis
MAGDSGIGTYISNVLPRIAARRPEWRLTVLGDRARIESLAWPRAANVDIRHCGSRIYTVREQVELVSKCPRGVDLFWSPNYNIPLGHRGPLMVTIHDIAHLALPEFAAGAAKQLYARTMFGAVRRRADVIVCDTAFSQREFVGLVGRPRADIEVVHLGVDERWHRAASLPAPRERRYIVYVGNVKPHKNIGVLVEAFASLRDSIPHDLVIVGRRDGLRTADREAERAAAALGDRVELTGEVPLERLQGYVGHADALVTTSLYEGFGFPPLEAMAAGCPALVSRIPTHEEVCGDAVAYCDPRDPRDVARSLERVLSDVSLRCNLRERGKRRVAELTWERCAGATLRAMERGLGEAGE